MKKIFEGLRVADLSTVLAGPSVATFFAELGAEVVKFENAHIPDVTRSWKLPVEDLDSKISAYFASVNYNKEYRKIDLNNHDDRSQLFSFFKTCDIIITNFKPGDDSKFGFTTSWIQSEFPRLIWAKIKGYESSEKTAYDVVLQAETGFMSMNGEANGLPTKMPVAMIDILAAHQLKEGILCALYQRAKTGKGCIVECSLEAAAISGLVNQASNYLMTNTIAERMGSLHPNIAPYGEIMICSDNRMIVLAIGSQKQFEDLCEVVGLGSLTQNPVFESNQQRVSNRRELQNILQGAFAKSPSAHWLSSLSAKKIPAGLIRSIDEVLQSPHLQHLILSNTEDGEKATRVSSAVFQLLG